MDFQTLHQSCPGQLQRRASIFYCSDADLYSLLSLSLVLLFFCLLQSTGVFEYLSCYLSELSLIDYNCVQFLPSVVAASAIFLSRFTIQPDVHPWVRNNAADSV